MKADINDWFNQDQFRHDVKAYMHRQVVTVQDIAHVIDMHALSVTRFITEGADVTLRTAAALATACDLSLDVYVLTQSQHDRYIDERHTVQRIKAIDNPVVSNGNRRSLAPRPQFWRQ